VAKVTKVSLKWFDCSKCYWT